MLYCESLLDLHLYWCGVGPHLEVITLACLETMQDVGGQTQVGRLQD